VSLNKDNNEEQEYNNSEIMCELFSFVAIVKKKFLKKLRLKLIDLKIDKKININN
jgi:hypothetical protein